MFPILWRVMSRYAPYITLPFAVIVGVVGYHLEDIMSDKYTPYQESISKKRTERLLEGNGVAGDSLKEKNIIAGVLERNLSPSLQKNQN